VCAPNKILAEPVFQMSKHAVFAAAPGKTGRTWSATTPRFSKPRNPGPIRAGFANGERQLVRFDARFDQVLRLIG
jgi:hypothetical protein